MKHMAEAELRNSSSMITKSSENPDNQLDFSREWTSATGCGGYFQLIDSLPTAVFILRG